MWVFLLTMLCARWKSVTVPSEVKISSSRMPKIGPGDTVKCCISTLGVEVLSTG